MDITSALGIAINPIIAKVEAGKSLKRHEVEMILLYQIAKDNSEVKEATKKLLENNDKLSGSLDRLSQGIVTLRVAVSELKGRLA